MIAGSPTASPASNGLLQWSSPLPYVFGGITITFGIITVALLVLACSHYKSMRDSSSHDKEEKAAKTPETIVDMEPKIVVIMAGDDQPTYVAKPSAAACHIQQS